MKTNEVKTKRVHNLIIVDESGSMEVIRKQAFVGMNETLQTVRKMQEKFPEQEQFVTLLTFDSGHTTWHYDNLPAAQTRNLDWKAYCPGGGTPLYDAIGKGISKTNAQIEEGDHVLVTIITSMWRPWPNPLPSTSIWSSSRAKQEPRPCSPANVAVVNAITAVSPRMPPCLLGHSSTKKSVSRYPGKARAGTDILRLGILCSQPEN